MGIVFALAMVAILAAPQAHPAIEYPPEINMPSEFATRLYAAIDADGVRPFAIQIAMTEALGIGPRLPMILVYGQPAKSSTGVCRGALFVYEEDEGAKRWQHTQLGNFAVAPAPECTSPPKTASRVVLAGNVQDSDITGIIAAIRSARVAPDDKGHNPEIPSFTKKASITALKVQNDEAAATITSSSGEQRTLLLARLSSGWFIFAAGDGLALPE